jgi:hypothetical protein
LDVPLFGNPDFNQQPEPSGLFVMYPTQLSVLLHSSAHLSNEPVKYLISLPGQSPFAILLYVFAGVVGAGAGVGACVGAGAGVGVGVGACVGVKLELELELVGVVVVELVGVFFGVELVCIK